jgi:AraC family transcriptional regulator
MNFDTKTLPAMRLAVVPHTGPYNGIGPAFQQLGSIAGPAGLFALPGAAMMGIYKDDPSQTPAAELRSAAAVVIPEGTPVPAGLTEERVAAGRFACVTHVGPYEQLPETWKGFMDALGRATNVRRRQTPSYEIYLNDPRTVKPSELLTQICMGIE